MSNDIAISVENLSKKYRIGGHARHNTIRDQIDDFIHHPFGIGRQMATSEDFWALKDVSFDIKKGDVVGVIGRNGSGKSTLLKILSRIVEPTAGKVTMHGRVASLLEVGTGFNPDLTGRENIFLNGSILGMSQKEIAGKYKEIVAFSGVEQFIDTPVKRYSSGMYVRLAFAVAAHLDSDILLVDEVLAVGDAEFQKKCLGKMKSLANGGRTVLFVSHDMSAVANLCNKCIYLETGVIRGYGNSKRLILDYLSGNNSLRADDKEIELISEKDRTGKREIIFSRLSIYSHIGNKKVEVSSGLSTTIEIGYTGLTANKVLQGRVSILISSSNSSPLTLFSTEMANDGIVLQPQGGTIECIIPNFPLTPSEYYLSLYLEVNGELQDYLDNKIRINVSDGKINNFKKNCPQGWEGRTIVVDHYWKLK